MSERSVPLELFEIDSLLSDEERAIRDTVRTFCADRVRPHLAEWFESGTLPARDLMLEMGSLGLLGMHIEGYGCAGVNAVSYGMACVEMGAADSGIRSLGSVQGSLAMYPIYRFGSQEQRDQYLPAMAKGSVVGCFGLTESDFGSNPGGMRTFARRDGSDWVLNGSKMWITNGSVADIAIVWAKTDEGIRGFIVPVTSKGFTALPIKHKMSMRASVTAELAFDDVRLPAEAMLPEARGLSGPLTCLGEARFGIVYGALGAARDCLDVTIAYAQTREIFGRPLAAFQLTQAKLADMTLELGKGFLLALHLGRLKEAGRMRPEQLSLGKLNSTREALAIARECRTILAANGITLEYSVIRHANNLESEVTYEGTSEVHQLVIGKALTGVSAFT